ncbi:MAG: response regulator [Flagellimonas sp.]
MDYRGTENGIDYPTENALQNILIIEDHKLTCQGYQLIVEQAGINGKIPLFKIHQAHSLKKAYQNLVTEGTSFDMVFLDICMKPFPEENLFSGEDLGRLLIERHPTTKILVMTSLTDKLRLEGILNTLEPHGFLIKCEVDEDHLVKAIQNILMGQSYYSPSIEKILQGESNADVLLNAEEKHFLHLLSKGVRNIETMYFLPWSLSKVEKRKRSLHKKLGVEKGNTMALVNKARELGII